MSKRDDLQFVVALNDKNATWSSVGGSTVYLVDKNVVSGVKGDDLRGIALGTWDLEFLLEDMLSHMSDAATDGTEYDDEE